MKLPKPNFAATMMAPATPPTTGPQSEAETQDQADYRLHDHNVGLYKEALKPQIRSIFLQCGFTIKEGETDLKPYVYDAAFALLGHLGGVMIDLEQAKKVLDSFKGEPGLVDLVHGPSHMGVGVHMVSPWDEEEKVFLGIPDGGE